MNKFLDRTYEEHGMIGVLIGLFGIAVGAILGFFGIDIRR